jgi:hypothetical protein
MIEPTIEVLPAAFDYGSLDSETRIVVQQKTSEIRTIARRAASDVIEIGQKLIEVKARLGHGKFGQWLEAEFSWQERTAQNFMAVADRFKNANIADLNFAPSALYMLSAPSVPEEARAAAIQRAQAGEPVGVHAAKVIIANADPQPHGDSRPTIEQFEAAVRAWLPTYSRERTAQLQALNDIRSNPQGGRGQSCLAKLLDSPAMPRPRNVPQIIIACSHVFDELQQQSIARTVEYSPTTPAADDMPAEIWQLEHALDQWLGVLCATPGERRLILEDIKNKRDPWYTRVFAANTLPPNRTNGDVLQAAHNLLDHLNQAQDRLRQLTPAGNGRTVYIEDRQPEHGNGSVGGPVTGSCKHCGRPLTDPAHVAAGCGPVCAAKAENNGANGHGNAGLKATPLPIGTADAAPADPSHELAAVVDAWLKEKVELAELPDDKSSFRYVLNQIVNARTMRLPPESWRNFIRFEQWPPDTTNDQKADAARAVLARLSGKPIDPVPAAQPAPATYQPIVPQFDRDQSRIRQLEAALTALIEYVESQAALREPDPDTVAAIDAATTVLRDPTYK